MLIHLSDFTRSTSQRSQRCLIGTRSVSESSLCFDAPSAASYTLLMIKPPIPVSYAAGVSCLYLFSSSGHSFSNDSLAISAPAHCPSPQTPSPIPVLAGRSSPSKSADSLLCNGVAMYLTYLYTRR